MLHEIYSDTYRTCLVQSKITEDRVEVVYWELFPMVKLLSYKISLIQMVRTPSWGSWIDTIASGSVKENVEEGEKIKQVP